MDIYKLDSQTRVCKWSGLRRVFTHLRTEVTATYRTLCANCGGEHLIHIPIEHATRLPIVPDKPQSTLCADCLLKVTPVRRGRWGKGQARKAPEDETDDDGEDL